MQELALPQSDPDSLSAPSVPHEPGLRKILGPLELTAAGIGCTIGAGIFVVTGIVARDKTGPALFLSYVVAGFASLLAALCYAEYAAMVPKAGSAYTYAHESMGRVMGWMIGWDLILEYGVSAASVARGFSGYFVALLKLFGLSISESWTSPPWHLEGGSPAATGGGFDVIAFLAVAVVTTILVVGIKESTRFNIAMVILKLVVILFAIFAGVAFVNNDNFSPFLPFGFFGISFFGQTVAGQTNHGQPAGVVAGASIAFFSYIGFDAVTTHAEEARNPQRDLPIAIILSLVISTALYVAVSVVLVGMIPYTELDVDAPISSAFNVKGMHWAEFIIAFGALFGLASVLLVSLLSQSRVLMSMSRDNLLPRSFFASIHPRFHTPWKNTILTGSLVAFIAALIPLDVLVEMVSIGTLMAFLVVCVGVIILRYTRPEARRPFRCPWSPFIPGLGALVCLILMFSLPYENWIRLAGWWLVGLVIYYLYGHRQPLPSPDEDVDVDVGGGVNLAAMTPKSEKEKDKEDHHVAVKGDEHDQLKEKEKGQGVTGAEKNDYREDLVEVSVSRRLKAHQAQNEEYKVEAEQGSSSETVAHP